MKKFFIIIFLITSFGFAQTSLNNWALLDVNNKVITVIVATPEVAATYPQAIQTYMPNAVTCVSAVGNSIVQAGIGDTYDTTNNVFITPKPYPSWILNPTTFIWEAPVAKPTAKAGSFYVWDEKTKNWASITIPVAVTTNNAAPTTL
jgi:hypothetical protein